MARPNSSGGVGFFGYADVWVYCSLHQPMELCRLYTPYKHPDLTYRVVVQLPSENLQRFIQELRPSEQRSLPLWATVNWLQL